MRFLDISRIYRIEILQRIRERQALPLRIYSLCQYIDNSNGSQCTWPPAVDQRSISILILNQKPWASFSLGLRVGEVATYSRQPYDVGGDGSAAHDTFFWGVSESTVSNDPRERLGWRDVYP